MAQPALALSLLQELGLAPAVYAPPEHLIPPPPDEGFDWARGVAVAQAAALLLAFRSNVTEAGEERNAQTRDETPHRGDAGVGGKEKANEKAPGGKRQESQGGKDGSGTGKKGEAPATLVRELFLCAALLPLAGVKHNSKKGKLVPAAQFIVSDSLKVRLCSVVTGMLSHAKTELSEDFQVEYASRQPSQYSLPFLCHAIYGVATWSPK